MPKSSKLELVVARIQHRFGPQSLIKGRPHAPLEAHPHISTGFRALDEALTIGGLPCGKISEWVGHATSGKTTIALKFLEQAQTGGRSVGYIDQARYFDADYAHRCGLNLSRLVVGTPYEIGEMLAMTESLVRSNSLSALVLDVMDVLWADPHTSGDIAQWLNRISLALARTRTALLIVRDSSELRSPALSALAHYACTRLHIVREEWKRLNHDIRGYQARVEVVKNKLGPAGRAVTIEIQFNGTVRGDGL